VEVLYKRSSVTKAEYSQQPYWASKSNDPGEVTSGRNYCHRRTSYPNKAYGVSHVHMALNLNNLCVKSVLLFHTEWSIRPKYSISHIYVL
jgi:hypothetical protein